MFHRAFHQPPPRLLAALCHIFRSAPLFGRTVRQAKLWLSSGVCNYLCLLDFRLDSKSMYLCFCASSASKASVM